MAEVLASITVETVVQELISFIKKKHGERGKKVQEVQYWRQSLEDICVLVKDYEREKYKSNGLKAWLNDLNTLVEDIQEELEDLKEEAQQQGIVCRIKNCFKTDEHNDITERIKQIHERRNFLLSGMTGAENRRIAGSLPSELELFGRESESEKIMNLLDMPIAGLNRFDSISIVGMPGIGKTTLAQKIYKDVHVASFRVKAWCPVSMDFNRCNIYRSIIEQLQVQCHSNDVTIMEKTLHGELEGKKFLIVLDDLWHDIWHELDALWAPFMAAERGSMFIITTRNRNVAKYCSGEERIVDLGSMSNEDCWSLFCSGLKVNINSKPNLIQIGKKLCDRCEGLPLAVALTRGGLTGNDNEKDWIAALNKLVSSNGESFLDTILRMSYDNLSDQMKKCFSFCTIFREDEILVRTLLIDYWIEAGIIENRNQSIKEMKDLGSQYFDQLVSRALLTRSSPNELLSEVHMMHDMIREMGMKVSGETYSRWEKRVGSWEKARHISISEQKVTDAIEELKRISKATLLLRTLIIDGGGYDIRNGMNVLFRKFKHLRVIEMKKFKVSKISNDLVRMKKLRILEIHHFDGLKKLPSVITKLDNLTKLRISHCLELKGPLPKLGSLLRLEELSITKCPRLTGQTSPMLRGLTKLSMLSLSNCPHLAVSLLQELCDLSSLKYFFISDLTKLQLGDLTTTLPLEIGRLTRLTNFIVQTCECLTGPIPPKLEGLTRLVQFIVQNCPGLTGPIPPELGYLTELRNINIQGCPGLVGPIFLKLRGPTELSYAIWKCPDLAGSIQPEYLLGIKGIYLGDCEGLTGPIPPEIGRLNGLRVFFLKNCPGVTGSIPPELGDLMELKELVIDGCGGLRGPIPPELGCLTGLSKLYLRNCEGLSGPLPPELRGLRQLIELSISECRGLVGQIPEDLGLLTSLRELNIMLCPGLKGRCLQSWRDYLAIVI